MTARNFLAASSLRSTDCFKFSTTLLTKGSFIKLFWHNLLNYQYIALSFDSHYAPNGINYAEKGFMKLARGGGYTSNGTVQFERSKYLLKHNTFYLEPSGGQNSSQQLILSTVHKIRHLWQLKRIIFQHRCLNHAAL